MSVLTVFCNSLKRQLQESGAREKHMGKLPMAFSTSSCVVASERSRLGSLIFKVSFGLTLTPIHSASYNLTHLTILRVCDLFCSQSADGTVPEVLNLSSEPSSVFHTVLRLT